MLRSCQIISPGPKHFETFRNNKKFLRWGVGPTLNPQAGGLPLVGCPRLPSIHNLRTRHAVVTRDPPNMACTCPCHSKIPSINRLKCTEISCFKSVHKVLTLAVGKYGGVASTRFRYAKTRQSVKKWNRLLRHVWNTVCKVSQSAHCYLWLSPVLLLSIKIKLFRLRCFRIQFLFYFSNLLLKFWKS
jgi:hypothetical protein